jgi:hypothetical protein
MTTNIPAGWALVHAALVELVACKDLKDAMRTVRSDPYYITQADHIESQYDQRQPLAWEAARKALAARPPVDAVPGEPVKAVAEFNNGSWRLRLGSVRMTVPYPTSGPQMVSDEYKVKMYAARINAEISGGVAAFGCDVEARGTTYSDGDKVPRCMNWCGLERCAVSLKSTPTAPQAVGEPVAWGARIIKAREVCDPNFVAAESEEEIRELVLAWNSHYECFPLCAAPVAPCAGEGMVVVGPRGGALKRFNEWFEGENFVGMTAREIASLGFDAGHTFWHETVGLSCATPPAPARGEESRPPSCKFAAGGAPCVHHCGDPTCLRS